MDGWMEKMDGWMDGEDGWIERGEASGWNRREASRQKVELHLENMQYQTQVPATRTLRYMYQFLNLETTESAIFFHENGHIYQAACSASIYRILQWGLIGQKLCREKAVCLIL